MKELNDHISSTVSIPDNELEEIVFLFESMIIEKDGHLIKTGQYCENYYFVETGSLRIYAEVDGKETTSWFAFEGYFFTELESYTYQCKTKYNIQAIEHTSILYISRKNMNTLLQKYPAWEVLLRKTWEQAFIKLAQVVLSFQTLNAKQRYEHLLDHPEFTQKAKQKDVASMLGITDTSLSRLRKPRKSKGRVH